MLFISQEIRHSLLSRRGSWLVVFILTPTEAIGPGIEVGLKFKNFLVFSFLNY